MLKPRTENIRNIGIIAHVDAGKTTVTERILVAAGVIHRPGEVHHGTATMDFDPIEEKRGITINAAAIPFAWGEHHVNLIDTPGHADFELEVERSLRVLDGAIVVLDASRGVEPQTEAVWRRADRYRIPRVVFVNKMDHPAADLMKASASLADRLNANPLVLEQPRESLIEAVCDVDEALMRCFLESEDITDAALDAALIRATRACRIFPVVSGAALKDLGVEEMMNLAVRFLPPPEVHAGQPAALVFKVTSDDHGPLAWVRVYAGSLRKGDKLETGGQRCRVGRLVRLVADERVDVDELVAGDIGAVIGLDARTGEVLHAPGAEVKLEGIDIPLPVMSLAIEPAEEHGRDKLARELQRMVREDPSLQVRSDGETGDTALFGLGELHLEVAIARLNERVPGGVVSRRPRVACREALAGPVEVDVRIKRQGGGPGMFAHVVVRFSPRSEGFAFESKVTGGDVPREYIAAVAQGIEAQMASGVVEGWPLLGLEAVVLGGSTHVKDSSELAFRQAGALALREAAAKVGAVVLEPWVRCTVDAPEEAIGAVVSELGRRRGVLEESAGQVCARAPLAELFGFASALASCTKGRAGFSLAPAGFERRPEK